MTLTLDNWVCFKVIIAYECIWYAWMLQMSPGGINIPQWFFVPHGKLWWTLRGWWPNCIYGYSAMQLCTSSVRCRRCPNVLMKVMHVTHRLVLATTDGRVMVLFVYICTVMRWHCITGLVLDDTCISFSSCELHFNDNACHSRMGLHIRKFNLIYRKEGVYVIISVWEGHAFI